MNENLTEIVFILDRSGSMGNITDDTIGGFNSFIMSQMEQEGEALLTTVLFDNNCEILYSGKNIKDVPELTSKQYYVRGTTALYDAVGQTINAVGYRLSKTSEDKKPSKVLFIITTDGYENASKVFNLSQINEMITHQKEKYNWEFMFLGANIDSMETAESFGIDVSNASNYSANSVGTDSLFTTMGMVANSYRETGSVAKGWNKDIK